MLEINVKGKKGTTKKFKPAKTKEISYDSAGVPKLDPVPMIHGIMMYQPVFVNEEESHIAHIVALSDNIKVAAVFTGDSLAVYFAGDAGTLSKLPEDYKQDDELRLILGTPTAYDAGKALGAILGGIMESFETPIPDVNAIAYKETM